MNVNIETLINNDLSWYLVGYHDGVTELKHCSELSAVLECGKDPEEYEILWMERCWNGEDLR